MQPKTFSPFCQENGPCADKSNFMVVGETGQGKTAASLTALRKALSASTGAGQGANKTKGSRHD